MTILFQNRTTNGTAAGPFTATTDTQIQVTVSGVFGKADVYLMFAQDGLRSAPQTVFRGPTTAIVNMKAGTQWWFEVLEADATTDLDASYLV